MSRLAAAQPAFDFDRYPSAPGWKEAETSRAAAKSVASECGHLQRLCFRAIKGSVSGLTADECAERLGISILSARPRLTELKAQGLIEDSGLRRANASSRKAKVWIASELVQAAKIH